MKYLRIFFLMSAVLLAASCGNKNAIVGSWQLQEFVYGEDTMSMDDFGIVQLWSFTSDHAEGDSLADYCIGSQYQEDAMDHTIAWRLGKGDDTLFTCDLRGGHRDTFNIVRLDNEMMVLRSQLKETPVLQSFKPVE